MSDLTDLTQHLKLEAVEAGSLKLVDFLGQLKGDPEIAETAPGVILRAIRKRGVIDILKEPARRQPYLELQLARRITLWKAFDHVRGSHSTVQRIINHLRAAANGGQQLKQALVLIGGPGCGKSFLADAIKATLEGELVYVVDGCPVHENPINLLKLLPKEQIDALATALEMHDPENGVTLYQLLNMAGDPCDHCWQKVMAAPSSESKDEKHDHADGACASGHGHSSEPTFVKEPNLNSVTIKKIRLTSRLFGIATWRQTPDGCSLLDALRQGSGGIIDLPEMCTVQTAQPGEVLQIDALIDATDKRAIPDTTHCNGQAGYLPLNAVILGQTNYGAWDRFIDGQSDPAKYLRRFNPMSVPYITARVEELEVYETAINSLKVKPHFDPNALLLAATQAVGSRLKEVPGLSPVDKVRLLNGEVFIVRKQQSSSSSYGSYGSSYGSYSSVAAQPAAWTDKDLAEAIRTSEGTDERKREGMFGLDLPFMLAYIGNIAQGAMQAPKNPEFPDHKPCITAIGMIDGLRNRLEAYRLTPKLPSEITKIVDTALSEWLKKPETIDAKPGHLEREYRRILRQQILDAFEPNYEVRAQDIFDRYRLHANAFGQGLNKFKIKGSSKDVDVDTKLLTDIDKGSSLKPDTLRDSTAYRGSIEAQINDLKFSKGTLPSEDAERTIDWTSLPELKQAIEDYLNAEIALKVERILAKKHDLLDNEDKVAFDRAFASFEDLGYCKICFSRALEYAKELKLWAKRQD